MRTAASHLLYLGLALGLVACEGPLGLAPEGSEGDGSLSSHMITASLSVDESEGAGPFSLISIQVLGPDGEPVPGGRVTLRGAGEEATIPYLPGLGYVAGNRDDSLHPVDLLPGATYLIEVDLTDDGQVDAQAEVTIPAPRLLLSPDTILAENAPLEWDDPGVAGQYTLAILPDSEDPACAGTSSLEAHVDEALRFVPLTEHGELLAPGRYQVLLSGTTFSRFDHVFIGDVVASYRGPALPVQLGDPTPACE